MIAATAKAPNRQIEQVIQLAISPFSFVCRNIIALYPPEQNRLTGPFSKKSRTTTADFGFQLVFQIVMIIAQTGVAEGLIPSFRSQRFGL
ncbi:hypothetical protein HQ945_11350 [Phyllobacterium sp. BT25]|uniref:Uncharacterized protein n=1 Tax=Phyllobacterium pellucidum TaxID=2740464 RepID=A0A849VPR8_9HYPH|nr:MULTISPECIES: hypothetical protein [Phyllobacterium]NTS31851.1 hypothetical protein [Phyllobacterium pellucidum]UGY09301.1 hypothetical protein LLE51_014960 [Phyllobacterium sp. T1018]